MSKRLRQAIRHERELREAQSEAFEHERELRMVYDTHERELRKQVEDATAANLARQAIEYERRLGQLNGEQARIATVLNNSVTRELFDIEMGHAIAGNRALETQVERMATQLNTLRGIAIFIGLPGVVAFVLALILVINNTTIITS